MHARRLLALLGLAAAAAVPEVLVRSSDTQVSFQAWLVVQLLGVIVAAIGVAAMFSVLGLGLVRLVTRPLMDRASTFVAWSFLRAPRGVLPIPLRLWHSLREAVDAQPGLDSDVPGEPVRRPWWQTPLALAVLALCGWGLAMLLVPGTPLSPPWVLARNLLSALAIHAFLLACAGLPPLRLFGLGRRTRLVPVALVGVGLLAVAAIAPRHPVVLRWFDPTAAVLALVAVGVLAGLRAGPKPGLGARWTALGGLLVPVGVVVLALGLVGRLQPVQQAIGLPGAVSVALLSLGAVIAPAGLYLVLQAQAKVSLPVFVSIVGVAAGTWALIVVLSVMGGFAGDLRAKMLVANAHALIERAGGPIPDAAALSRTLRQVPGVAAVSPQVRGDAILSSAFNVNNFVSVRGIDPSLPEVQRELGGTLRTGSLLLLLDRAALGSDRSLQRKPADEQSDLPPAPTLGSHATPTGDDQDLEALRRLAPGPGEQAPPQDRDRPRMILLPSGERPVGTAPAATETDLGTTAPQRPPPARDLPVEPDLRRLLDDDRGLSPLAAEPVDVPVAPGIVLGAELARSLQVELGDRVELVTPDADVGPTGLRPRVRTFRVAGTFETGLYEADSKVAYVELTEAARYFNLAGAANVLELRLTQPEVPDPVVAALQQTLKVAGAPKDLEVVDWRQLNRSLFSALAFERLVIFLVLGLIILVAAFSIVSALTMVILQKHDSIAMLRAMGSTAGAVRGAFVQMGGVIGLIGTTAGGILGVGTCVLIQRLGIQLPEAYYVRTLPVAMQTGEIAAVALAAVGVSLAATVFPATSAARLSPLEGLRHG